MKISCLIIDDEKDARDGLSLLCESKEELNVIGICKNGIEAIDQIQTLQPQLVLLDIQMPGINGFEVIQNIGEPIPEIIFITAHDQYAIKAFDVNAIDYLLKPFSDVRFYAAVDKAIERIKLNNSQNLQNLIAKDHLQKAADKGADQMIIIKVDGNVYQIPEMDILFIEAFDYYIKINTERRHFVVRDSMKNMEHRLSTSLFQRVHKSYIVNKTSVKSLRKVSTGNYELLLKDNKTIRVSRNMLRAVRNWLA